MPDEGAITGTPTPRPRSRASERVGWPLLRSCVGRGSSVGSDGRLTPASASQSDSGLSSARDGRISSGAGVRTSWAETTASMRGCCTNGEIRPSRRAVGDPLPRRPRRDVRSHQSSRFRVSHDESSDHKLIHLIPRPFVQQPSRKGAAALRRSHPAGKLPILPPEAVVAAAGGRRAVR